MIDVLVDVELPAVNLPLTDLSALHTACVTSPLGDLLVHFTHVKDSQSAPDRSVIHSVDYIGNCKTQYATHQCHSTLPPSWSQKLLAYFAGDINALEELPVSLLIGTEFQQSVWLALRNIPAGNTWTYKDVANHIGRPKAVRAVGQALSKNPIPIVLPCHRVIKSSGEIGGYAGSSELGGMRKRYLLWHEGQLEAEPQDLF